MSDDTENQKADLLYGCPAIASYLELTEDAVYHLARQNKIPIFRMGGRFARAAPPSPSASPSSKQKSSAA